MNTLSPTSFNTPDLSCLNPDNIDNVGRALLSLLREVAVLNDRVVVLEHLLEKHGILPADAVDTHQPDNELAGRSQEAMTRMIGEVLAALRGADGD